MRTFLLTFSAMLSMSLELSAQDRTVSGKVKGEEGAALPGVNVLVKGTTVGTVTDIDGNYRLQVPEEADVLSFSFIGYNTVEETINGRSTIDVTLTGDVSELSEVVVVGYGTQLKTDVTGNIAQVSGEEMENIPVPSIEQAMQGRAAGVFVESGNGKLGQGIKVRVRGAASVSASNEPLYVVDGVIITTENLSGTDAATNPLSDINFNDVESVQVLKDASAAAIYGSRAANGVVLITTKRGQSGRTRFNVGYLKGWSSPTRKAEWLNGPQYYQAFNEAFDNQSAILQRDEGEDFGLFYYGESGFTFDQVLDAELGNWSADVNDYWADQAYQDDAGIDQIDLSASGGGDKTQFYTSLQFTNQQGILINNAFERLSGRVNVDHQASDYVKIGLNFSLARSVNDRLSDDNEFTTPMQMLALPPIQPFRNEDGSLNENTLYFNGLIAKENVEVTTTVFRNISNIFAEITLFPSLTFRSEAGADILTQNEEFFYGRPVDSQSGYINGGGQSRWVNVQNYSTNNFFTYRHTFAERHNVELTGGMSFQIALEDRTSVEAQTFPLDAFRKLAGASTVVGGRSNATDFTFLSYFARANYKFDNKYLLSLSGRLDGSSKFGDNEKYGFFPAGSVGWIITEEGFMESLNALSFLKLRASVGLTGNAPRQNFASLGTFDAITYDVLGGIVPGQLANPNLKWETTLQTDIGIDFGLFDDRITGEVDYYVKNTTDVLLNSNVPGTSGFLRQFVNVGELQNKGFEVLVNSNNAVGAFSWSTSLNFALNRNKITNLNGNVIEGGYVNRAVEGEAIGVFFAREYAGVDPENGDALYYLNREASTKELEDEVVFIVGHLGNRLVTPVFDLADRVVVGNPNPDWIGGITNNLSYKGLDLSFLFQFVIGNDAYNGAGQFQRADFAYFDNHLVEDWKAAWRTPGQITDVPQARLFAGNGDQVSSRYLQDASFVRLKTLTLGYNLPSSVLDRLSMQSIRFYVSAQNLLTFTDYDLNDPEVNTDYLSSGQNTGNISQGNDFYAAPQVKTVSVGVKLGF